MLGRDVLQKVLAVASWETASRAKNITHLFGPHLSANATIVLATDAHYTDIATQRWTTHSAPSFVGAIQPATVDDVQSIVKIASAHEIQLLATGGGHGVSGTLKGIDQGVQVDLAKFRDVRLDRHRDLLTVGGATTFSEVIDPLYRSGYQFPVGTAYCVGIVGATLGGGVSAGQGVMGLLSDLLESAEVVTASGHALTVSDTENPQLFWALRGAGANFGIVTSATYRVPRFINGGEVVNANFLYPASMSHAVFQALAGFDYCLGAELAFNIGAFYNPAIDEMVLIVNANYHGPVEEARTALQPFADLGPAQSEYLKVPWPRVFETSYFGIDDTKACSRNQHVNMYSIAALRTDVRAMSAFMDELLAFSRSNPAIPTTFVIHRFPTQAVQRVPDDTSAYPHRDLKMHIQLESSYADRAKDIQVDRFLQSARAKFVEGSGYANSSVYVNFAHGDEGPEAWYGTARLPKLGELKHEWDPTGMFSFFNPVPRM